MRFALVVNGVSSGFDHIDIISISNFSDSCDNDFKKLTEQRLFAAAV